MELQGRAVDFRRAGQSVLQIEAAWVMEETGKRSEEAVRWELSEAGEDGSRRLTLQLDRSGLNYPMVIDPTWSLRGSMKHSPQWQTMTRLNKGTVLVVGGINSSFNAEISAELYNLATVTWSFTGSFARARQLQTATLLASGKVMVVGGS